MWWVVLCLLLPLVSSDEYVYPDFENEEEDHYYFDDSEEANTEKANHGFFGRIRRAQSIDDNEFDTTKPTTTATEPNTTTTEPTTTTTEPTTTTTEPTTTTTKPTTNETTNTEKANQGFFGQIRRAQSGLPTPTTTTPTTTTTKATTTTTTNTEKANQGFFGQIRRAHTTTTTSGNIDVPALVRLLSDLTEAHLKKDLVRKFNESLQEYNVPTCGSEDIRARTKNVSGAVVAKCFVCGLTQGNLPENAHCSDAFAGDFIPVVPIDPSAAGQIGKFRKYCRALNEPGVREFDTDTRSVYGRFTGGCGVRWIDLSGLYTQRVCRNRRQPVRGLHLASRRMAKLEMALASVDNGCIQSPMASLVPLSRGISLYARFHACVCTGNWCNRASLSQHWTPYMLFTLLIITANTTT